MRIISLFSGAGGLDWGFWTEGLEVAFACDTDPSARSTYDAQFNHSSSSTCVTAVPRAALRKADILLAGPPCQGFSSIGRRDPGDSRNRLFVHTVEAVARAQPKIFIIENVRGLSHLSNGQFVTNALRTLRAAELSAEVIDIDCSRLGVAQRRRRILIVGGYGATGKRVTHSIRELAELDKAPVTVGDVLLPVPRRGSLPNHVPMRHNTEWYDAVISRIKPGQKLCDTRLGPSSVHSWDIPEVFGRVSSDGRNFLKTLAAARRRVSGTNLNSRDIGDGRAVSTNRLASELSWSREKVLKQVRLLLERGYITKSGRDQVDLARKFNGRFKRLSLDAPAPAVLREFRYARNMLHPTRPRGLTVRECARLQGFPDDYEFSGSLADQYSLVANAFPPPVSSLVAAAVSEIITNRASRKRKKD